jgi:hypothetical protein
MTSIHIKDTHRITSIHIKEHIEWLPFTCECQGDRIITTEPSVYVIKTSL